MCFFLGPAMARTQMPEPQQRYAPAQIVADPTATISLEVRVSMGVPDSVTRCMRRGKAKVLPKSEASLPDVVLPDEW